MTDEIRPFANALEYGAWEDRNCCRCTKAHVCAPVHPHVCGEYW